MRQETNAIVSTSINNGNINCKESNLQIYEELGSGSFGKVYRAFETSLKKVVAVKMIELDTSSDIEDVLLELKFLSELRCEQVTRHFYARLYDSVLFVVMEYCAVGSCLHMLRKCGVFKEPAAIHVLHETLKGIEYIHGQNKIHRDLKSANILVTETGCIKIADFGVSAQLSQTLPERNSFMGTPYWMAPEIIEAAHYDTAVDIWSLGIVAFELVTGAPPYRKMPPTEAMVKIVKNGAPALPHNIRGIPISGNFVRFVASCLEMKATERPSSSELLENKLFRGRLGYGSPNIRPPHDFMSMVRAVMRKRSAKAENEEVVHGVEDLAILAPAKSEHSRPNLVNVEFDYGTNDCLLNPKNDNKSDKSNPRKNQPTNNSYTQLKVDENKDAGKNEESESTLPLIAHNNSLRTRNLISTPQANTHDISVGCNPETEHIIANVRRLSHVTPNPQPGAPNMASSICLNVLSEIKQVQHIEDRDCCNSDSPYPEIHPPKYNASPSSQPPIFSPRLPYYGPLNDPAKFLPSQIAPSSSNLHINSNSPDVQRSQSSLVPPVDHVKQQTMQSECISDPQNAANSPGIHKMTNVRASYGHKEMLPEREVPPIPNRLSRNRAYPEQRISLNASHLESQHGTSVQGVPNIQAVRQAEASHMGPTRRYNKETPFEHSIDSPSQVILHSAILRVLYRTKYAEAVSLIQSLEQEIYRVNSVFPGFIRALIEEICRAMLDKPDI